MMRAMVMRAVGEPLREEQVARRPLGARDVRLKVAACAVCRTDLHVFDGELPDAVFPLVLGHEIVGTVIERGRDVTGFDIGARVGVPWLGWTCGECAQCRAGRENLCPDARFTGYQIDGGFAEETVADSRFCFAMPRGGEATQLAPLLCAGLIGHRALVKTGGARRLGLYGFGAAAHIVAQVARFEGREVYAFTRAGDETSQHFARELGAAWAGPSTDAPPVPLDAAIIFAPVGPLVPQALRAVVPGGIVVCAGIHMSDIPSFPYAWLWGERTICSVANLTRLDGESFLAIAPRVPVRTDVETLPLGDANDALRRLRAGEVRGALVLVP
jgi:propanol-preferring alcohol dehydrogenase